MCVCGTPYTAVHSLYCIHTWPINAEMNWSDCSLICLFLSVSLKGSYNAILKITILCVWCNRICWHALMLQKHDFSNYCSSSMPRLSQTRHFLQHYFFLAFIQSNLQCIQATHFFLISMCVPWELNPQPFVLLMQCSTNEPQKHKAPPSNKCRLL